MITWKKEINYTKKGPTERLTTLQKNKMELWTAPTPNGWKINIMVEYSPESTEHIP